MFGSWFKAKEEPLFYGSNVAVFAYADLLLDGVHHLPPDAMNEVIDTVLRNIVENGGHYVRRPSAGERQKWSLESTKMLVKMLDEGRAKRLIRFRPPARAYHGNPGVSMRRNPMSIVKDDKVFRILIDGRDTGKYATTREKAMEIALRMTDEKPAKKSKKAADPFAFRPFAAKKYAVPPLPPRPAVAPPPIVVPTRDVSGSAPFKKDARTNWTLLKDVVANVPTWGRRSTFKVNETRINVEPLLPAKGYSVFYVKAPGFGETDVAYLVRTPEGMDNRLINLSDIADAWMLTALDDYDYRRAPEAVLKKAVNDALKTHSLNNPLSYIL
jgi:hypothetical protein